MFRSMMVAHPLQSSQSALHMGKYTLSDLIGRDISSFNSSVQLEAEGSCLTAQRHQPRLSTGRRSLRKLSIRMPLHGCINFVPACLTKAVTSVHPHV